ncbi:MAG: hypothetical protein NZM18_12475 [Thermoflexales bacterium]|nr:hypothetical protein [Thermoflexales bacterium]MDW8350272.1 hypothetical protein [Anaerolineae bacterium]
MIRVVEVDTADRAQVRRFLDFPFHLYRDVPQWVPPLAGDAARWLDRKRHPFFRHSEAAFFLAYRDAEVCGRICVLNNRHYNQFNAGRTAHFFLFECEDDVVTSCALFDAACGWARRRGLERIEGPKGMTALDGLGLLVAGFEHRPALGIPYNRDYYPKLLAAAGFVGQGDIVSGYLSPRTLNKAAFDRIDRVAERVRAQRGLRVVRFTSRRELRRAVSDLLNLYNGALGRAEGNVPFTPDEAKTMADQIIWFADPRLIKLVYKADKPIGFLLAYPDISEAIRRVRGRLWPLGWFTLWRALRSTLWVNVNGMGILPEHRGGGGTAVLFSEMRRSIIEGGFEHADLVQIGVENLPMQREMRHLGICFYKTHRMYARPLTSKSS